MKISKIFAVLALVAIAALSLGAQAAGFHVASLPTPDMAMGLSMVGAVGMTYASFATEGTYTPDALVAGNHELLVGRKVTILTGQNLLRGTVMGKITASGKYIASLAAAVDGSEVPDLILAEAADATAADVSALAYARGDFTTNALTIGAGHTAASIAEGLRAKGITLLAAIA
jgi:hypothetical protein